jgi:hypothetical protein
MPNAIQQNFPNIPGAINTGTTNAINVYRAQALGRQANINQEFQRNIQIALNGDPAEMDAEIANAFIKAGDPTKGMAYLKNAADMRRAKITNAMTDVENMTKLQQNLAIQSSALEKNPALYPVIRKSIADILGERVAATLPEEYGPEAQTVIANLGQSANRLLTTDEVGQAGLDKGTVGQLDIAKNKISVLQSAGTTFRDASADELAAMIKRGEIEKGDLVQINNKTREKKIKRAPKDKVASKPATKAQLKEAFPDVDFADNTVAQIDSNGKFTFKKVGESGAGFTYKSSDNNSIRGAVAGVFGGIYDPTTGNFTALSDDVAGKVLGVASRATRIYIDGEGSITHEEAAAQAAQEAGISVTVPGPARTNAVEGIRPPPPGFVINK